MEQKNSIFNYLNYIEFLIYQVKINKKVYAYKAQLAEMAGCQRSFISQVINDKAHISIEHAIGLASFWALSEIEKDYFLNLVLLARTSNKKLKEHLLRKLEAARKDSENLTKRIQEKTVLGDESASIFYSNWQYLAVTILISIPKFRTVGAIATRLGVSDGFVQKTLVELKVLGLVQNIGTEWVATNSTIHVPRDSQYNTLNHSHWRQRALQNAFLADDNDIHYTSVCTLTLNDAERIRQIVFRLIDESRKIVEPSKEEEIFCLTCDWFKV